MILGCKDRKKNQKFISLLRFSTTIPASLKILSYVTQKKTPDFCRDTRPGYPGFADPFPNPWQIFKKTDHTRQPRLQAICAGIYLRTCINPFNDQDQDD